MKTLCVIPARYASERLPGKALLEIGGKPLVQHVYDRVMQVDSFTEVVVATDDDRIFQKVKEFGGEVLMTKPDHTSGTERLMEVAGRLPDYDLYVNVQGDEPLIPPDLLDQICREMQGKQEVSVHTSSTSMDENEIHDPNAVKVVTDENNRALYFSRASIPHARSGQWVAEYHQKHIGVYFFTSHALQKIRNLPAHPIQKYESLEQLRWLLNGIPIYVHATEYKAFGVDTPEDLERLRKIMGKSV